MPELFWCIYYYLIGHYIFNTLEVLWEGRMGALEQSFLNSYAIRRKDVFIIDISFLWLLQLSTCSIKRQCEKITCSLLPKHFSWLKFCTFWNRQLYTFYVGAYIKNCKWSVVINLFQSRFITTFKSVLHSKRCLTILKNQGWDHV